ncbi:hypothetical protein KSC_008140 [Ktedonobacter sp. SOSP1-52]|uniref:DUF3592 domain-containing protein n=1 Tax=Ktedonobacter sp. SOSP1-52 TaxID=2778366 RepID=UPI0019156795|nr:DUF3592 domain-containing protein [Ktedonobacter sp. SOSP1-52]GHO61922.1 hypothetical protein KSC_008140 [Ktedonobacter sp. SOSP1-52]
MRVYLIGLPLVEDIRIVPGGNLDMRRAATFALGLIGGIFLLIGLPFAIIAFFFYTSSVDFMQGAVTTQGSIIACNMQYDSQINAQLMSSTCEPVVRFRTQQGEVIQFTSNFSSSSMNEGDEIPVSYHPAHPHDARISSFIALWLLPLIFGAIGGVMVLVAIILFVIAIVVALRRRRQVAYYNSPYTPPYPPYSGGEARY